MLEVPVFVEDNINNKDYYMKYLVGFVGCEQNEKKKNFSNSRVVFLWRI